MGMSCFVAHLENSACSHVRFCYLQSVLGIRIKYSLNYSNHGLL